MYGERDSAEAKRQRRQARNLAWQARGGFAC